MNDDGTMARMPRTEKVRQGTRHQDLHHRRPGRLPAEKRDPGAEGGRGACSRPRFGGDWRAIAFENDVDKHGPPCPGQGRDRAPDEPVLVRVHSECLTGDVLGSQRCDCGEQLHRAMEMIEKEGKGVILYMRQEGRGIGLINKLESLCTPGSGARYGGSQPGTGFQGRPARLRHRRADPGQLWASARSG